MFKESRKRGRSVGDNFKNYQFYEKETKAYAMKCRFETEKILRAAKETKHTIATSDGKTIHKKLASNTLNFSHQRKQTKQVNLPNKVQDAGLSGMKSCVIRTKESNRNSKNNQQAPRHSRQCQPNRPKKFRISP